MHPPVFFVRAGKMAAAQILSVTKLPARRYNKAREKVMHMRDIGKKHPGRPGQGRNHPGSAGRAAPCQPSDHLSL